MRETNMPQLAEKMDKTFVPEHMFLLADSLITLSSLEGTQIFF
jgi:hypothetical protein